MKSYYYKHYKNKPYKLITEAKHSEDLSDYVVYECLYPNETAQVWVRPKNMFNEISIFNEKKQPRFQEIEFKIKTYHQMHSDIQDQIFTICHQNFSNFSAEKFLDKIRHKDNILILCAFDEDKIVGFKVGYEQDILRFYSWLGAVDQKYRGLGIAKQLMLAQHEWAIAKKYKFVETKSENHFKSMIALNIFSGFEIIGTETSPKGQIKILFRKKLSLNQQENSL